jgi:uncharacterized peroxidase-related enzyme
MSDTARRASGTPHVPPLPPAQATREAQAVYEEFYRRMAFPSPPNFITTQGHSPAAARGTWELVRNVLVGGEIPRWKKEMIFVAISRDRNCRYCVAAHVACCRMLGADVDQLVKDVNLVPDPVLREMILFALKCAREPQSLTGADYDRLRARKLSQSEIVELIAMSGLAVYANIMADATGMAADEMFTSL